MLSFQEFSTWPVFCTKCDTMTEANMMASELACLACGSQSVTKYDADHLVRGGSQTVSEWRPNRLTDGDYFCPGCKTYNLHFQQRAVAVF